MATSKFSLRPDSSRRTFAESLWQHDPRRQYLVKPNRRAVRLMGVLTVLSVTTLVTFWMLLPYFVTEEMLMARLSERDIGGLEKEANTTYELAAVIRKKAEQYSQLGTVVQERDRLKGEAAQRASSLEQYQKTAAQLNEKIAGLEKQLKASRDEMASREPELHRRMKNLKAIAGKTAGGLQNLAQFLQSPASTEKEWRARAEYAHQAVGNLLEAAELADGEDQKRFLSAASDTVRIAALHRSRELRELYLAEIITEVLGPKFSKSFNLARSRFDGELAVAMLPEIIGPTAGIPLIKLQFAPGDSAKDAGRLRENWLLYRKPLSASKTEPGITFAREFTLGAIKSVSDEEPDLQAPKQWIADGLKSVQDLSRSYINPIPGLLGDEEVDQAFSLFMRSLRQQLEDQQPYMMWALVKFGQRLLAEAAIQPPALAEEKTWQRNFELDKPYVFKHSLNRFELLDYQSLVCSIYADVLLYPAQADASSPLSTRDTAQKKTNRRTTIELEPGVYYFALDEELNDDLLVKVKGRYALETAGLYIKGSPFGCFVEVPYTEGEGYWVTPVRGAIHRFDAAQDKPEEKALPLVPENKTSWVKHDLRSGASGAWRTFQVQAAQKFVRALKAE